MTMSALETIGMAGLGAGVVGAAAGAYAGAVSPYEPNPSAGYTTTNAAVGAVAGLGASAIAYGLGSGTVSAGEYAFKNKESIGKAIGGALESFGEIGLRAGKTAGNAVMYGAEKAATAGLGVADFVGETMLHKLTEAEAAKEAGSRMFGHKLSGKGKFIMAGVIAGSAIMGGFRQYNEDRLGAPTGMMDLTPRPEPLDDNASRMAETYGAGGDLVFALNANRRG